MNDAREWSPRPDLYPDPDGLGMMCESFSTSGITGADCSNVW